MNVIVLKTNIQSREKAETLIPIFDNHKAINQWTVDTEDIDNVLRIELKEHLDEREIISIINSYGFFGEDLKE